MYELKHDVVKQVLLGTLGPSWVNETTEGGKSLLLYMTKKIGHRTQKILLSIVIEVQYTV
jgi:hypothetical protein